MTLVQTLTQSVFVLSSYRFCTGKLLDLFLRQPHSERFGLSPRRIPTTGPGIPLTNRDP